MRSPPLPRTPEQRQARAEELRLDYLRHMDAVATLKAEMLREMEAAQAAWDERVRVLADC